MTDVLGEQIDDIYEQVDSLLIGGDFAEVDRRISAIDVPAQETEILVAWLIVTLAASHELRQRANLCARIREHLRDEPERDAILSGLS